MPNATTFPAPNPTGSYTIRCLYDDPDNSTWNSSLEVLVINETIDKLKISTDKSNYNPSETVKITSEAVRIAGDNILFSANVTVNGTVRNGNKTILSYFNCTTDEQGQCTILTTSSSTYGEYIIELDNFKAFSTFQVRPFKYNLYIKDDLGKSLKNTFKLNEQASVEVAVLTNSTEEEYTFTGQIKDRSGNIIKEINATSLTNNNSYINRYVFTVDTNNFDYGIYIATVTVTKTGDGSVSSSTSFEVRDWSLNFQKREVDSGFEYSHSIFPNGNASFQIFPTYRSNGSVIPGINASFFNISLKDRLGNNLIDIDPSWNSTCGIEGCYDFSFVSPLIAERYTLSVTLAEQGDSQTEQKTIKVIDTIIGAQTTTKDGELKELFGPNEYVYISVSTYNNTNTDENITNANIVSISSMNGTTFTYTEKDSFSDLNITTGSKEWAWNFSTQQFKVVPPRAGGVYDVHIEGKNNSVSTLSRFIVNPYDVCLTAKTTAGDVTTESAYYAWQYKTTDTIYFELAITQAVNRAGRATADNFTNSGTNSSHGLSSACTVDTQTTQVVTNATISIKKVRNTRTGELYTLNDTTTVCQSDNDNGQYTCTLESIGDWDGGEYNVEFEIVGEDGETSDIAFGLFEARAFYLYGWSQTWQNKPDSDITLTVQMYEAGSNWWGSYGSAGLSGTVSLEKIEYMGRTGENIWPPLEYNYTNVSSETTSITTGQGTLTLDANYAEDGTWNTGQYRAILKGVDSNGNTDYGYAWFNIKRWEVYGVPVDCNTSGCSYKNSFNSKDNVTLFIRIVPAGSWSDTGGTDLNDNITIQVKKLQDCRTWPCKELNSSSFTSQPIYANKTSNWYWNTNGDASGDFLLHINTSGGKNWGTGSYRVFLDVNDTESGTAWFNTIAFYTDAFPSNENGSQRKYQFKNEETIHFNLTTTKSHNRGYWSGGAFSQYSPDDFINTSFVDASINRWDQGTSQSIEYTYPENINITPDSFNGTSIVNLSYLDGNWPSGYYHGEITLNNSDNEEASARIWFQVKPFRIALTNNNYNIDSDLCLNTTLNIYEPYWYDSTPFYGNFSITDVYEDQWDGSYTRISYTNFTNTTFNASIDYFEVCPNGGSWGAGNWGGYHSLKIEIKDNVLNNSELGWVSFRSVPFAVSWGTVANPQSGDDVNVTVTLTKPTSGNNATGNLSRLTQWRWDNYQSTQEDYDFMVGTCDTRVTSTNNCFVNGTRNVTIFAPSNSWKLGYNYIRAEWVEETDATSVVKDWSNIYFNALEKYNGYFENRDANNNWKYNFALDETPVIKVYARDANYNAVAVNITQVEYAKSEDNCWDDFCRTYTSTDFGIINNAADNLTISGNGLINISAPAGGWERSRYTIRATIKDPSGTSTALIKGGEFRTKNTTVGSLSITAPVMNSTHNNSIISFSATSTIEMSCWLNVYNFDNAWWCSSWNETNGTVTNLQEACNTTKYSYNGTNYHNVYVGNSYVSEWDGGNSSWSSGSNQLITGGVKTHTYSFDTSNWPAQHYSIELSCNDEDYNYVRDWVSFNYTNLAI